MRLAGLTLQKSWHSDRVSVNAALLKFFNGNAFQVAATLISTFDVNAFGLVHR
jgi:hypothetical protein